jgi:hypothetical protein
MARAPLFLLRHRHRRMGRRLRKPLLPFALALLLPQLQATATASAPQPPQAFDFWAWISGLLQNQGAIGFFALAGLAIAGYALSQAQNLEALLRLLGRGPKNQELPFAPRRETHGDNSPLISGGTFSAEGKQFIGGVHTHQASPSPTRVNNPTVEVSGSGNTTLTNVRVERDVIVTQTIHHHPKPELPPKGTPRNLPFSSIGPLFKGRSALIELLETTSRPLALIGPGGVGKTRLAIEHAWRQIGRCSAVFLVSAGSVEALNRNLAGLCDQAALDLPEQTLTEEAAQRQAVLHWLQSHPGWLLILDNVDSPEAAAAVEALLPQFSGGQLLITTRLRDWSAAVQRQEVELLSPKAATAFLLERTAERRRPESDDAAMAEAIAVQDLGRLALALEQAGAYISQRRLSLSAYRNQWQRNRQLVLAWNDPRLMQYDRSLATTWLTSYQQVDASARTLLRRLAWLSPEPIPESLLEVAIPGEPNAGGDGWEAISQLEGYSLLNRSAEAPTLSVHRLVQEVVRLWQQQPNEPEPNELEQALAWLDAAFVGDPDDVRNWGVLDPLAPHALAVAGFGDRAGISEPTARLFNQLGLLFFCKAAHSDAEPLMQRVVEIAEDSYGSEHPEVAIRLNNLAQLLKATNRLAEAEPLMRRALAIDEVSYGSDHPRVATELNNLASLMLATNRHVEAEPLMRRALAIDEASYGKEHPNVARDLNNLAQLLQDTNRLAEAEPLMRRALAIDEASYGNEHPDVATNLNNLAVLLQATNRLAEAEPLMRRSVEILIAFAQQGYQHPNLEAGLGNYLSLLQSLELSESEIQARLQSLLPPS